MCVMDDLLLRAKSIHNLFTIKKLGIKIFKITDISQLLSTEKSIFAP